MPARPVRPVVMSVVIVAVTGVSAPVTATPRTQSVRPPKPYTVRGAPVKGTPTPSGAPKLAPGEYLDTLEKSGGAGAPDGTSKYYLVDLPKGVTPYVAATLVPPPGRKVRGTDPNLSVAVKLTTATQDCEVGSQRKLDRGLLGDLSYPTAVLTTAPVGSAGWRCSDATSYAIQVSRGGDAYPGRSLPVEIAVRLEPPVDPSVELPEPVIGADGVPAPVSHNAAPIAAGGSYNDATALVPGPGYSDSVVTGESRFYTVHLEWGQRLSFRVVTKGGQRTAAQNAETVWARVYNPLRAKVDLSDETIGSNSQAGLRPGTMLGSTRSPVRYRNREGYDATGLAIAGDYYLVVNLGQALGPSGVYELGYTITVSVIGKPSGAPTYLTDPVAARTVPAPARASGGSVPLGLAAGGGVGALAVVLLGWLVVRRARRGRPSAG